MRRSIRNDVGSWGSGMLRTALVMLVLSLLAAGCGGGSGAQVEPTESADQPAPTEDGEDTSEGTEAASDGGEVAASGCEDLSFRLGTVPPSMTGVVNPIFTDQGFFEDAGWDVEIITSQSGSDTIQALVGGDLQTALVGGPEVVRAAQQAPGRVVIIAGVLDTLPYILATAPDVTQPEDLQGQAVGVSRVGSLSDLVARAAIRELGLEPNQDVTIQQAGGNSERLAAVSQGSIAGAPLSVELQAGVEEAGLNVLLDLGEQDVASTAAAYVANADFLEENPCFADAFLQTAGAAMAFMKDPANEEAVRSSLATFYADAEDSEEGTVADAYDFITTPSELIFPPDGLVDREALQALIDQVNEIDGEPYDVTPEDMVYDESLIRD